MNAGARDPRRTLRIGFVDERMMPRCPVCGDRVTLTRLHRIRYHHRPGVDVGRCPATRLTMGEARLAARGEVAR